MYPVAPVSEDCRVHAQAYLSFGRMTLSITWMTPLVAAMSVLTTFAPPTVTPPSRETIVSVSPLTALAELHLDHVGRHDFPGDDVRREDALQLRLVLRLQQRLERSCRQLRERLVGRREHRERPGSLECLDQAGRLRAPSPAS